MLVNCLPPSVLSCHCTVGIGDPSAVAENVAALPVGTVSSTCCLVTTGALAFWTVSVAASEVAGPPTVLVNTARYWLWFIDAVVFRVKVALVALGKGAN